MPACVAVSIKRNPLGSSPHVEATDESTIRARSLLFNAIRVKVLVAFKSRLARRLYSGYPSGQYAVVTVWRSGKPTAKDKNALTFLTQAVQCVTVFMECLRLSPHPHCTCGERESKDLT